jgi:hypothetical protein
MSAANVFTDSRVGNCRGSLLKVFIWNGADWSPTPFNEQFPLEWSFSDEPSQTIEHGSELFLNVCAIDDQSNTIIPTTQQTKFQFRKAPRDGLEPFIHYPDAEFKFVVRVTGDPHAGDTICLGIKRRVPWGLPTVRVLPCE